MKSINLIRFYLSSFNKPTILQNLKSYKGSPAQQHLHDYVRSEAQLQKAKKEKIDYDFITRQSAGVMMFRQFAFQQKTQQTLVPHSNCYLPPTGAWTYAEINKQLGQADQLTKSEAQNIEIMSQCQPDIENSIKKYYENIGKKNYQFNLQQEINKLNQMTDQEFRHYAKVLHNKGSLVEQQQVVTKKNERIIEKNQKNGNFDTYQKR